MINRIAILNRGTLRSGAHVGSRSQEAAGTHPYRAFRDRQETSPWMRSLEPTVQTLMTSDSMVSTLGGWERLVHESAQLAGSIGVDTRRASDGEAQGNAGTQHPGANDAWECGQSVNVLDSNGQWRLAEVVDMSAGGGAVLVRLNGGVPPQSDEWIQADSSRIAPHQGPSSTPQHDTHATGVEPQPQAARTTWYEGQWLDALDTVGQWLEAVVLRVSPDEGRVFIHYNGWTTRWDEWIDGSSPRLAPFRSHTVHTPGRRLQPVPMVIPSNAPIPPPAAESFINVLPAVLAPLSQLLQVLGNVDSSLQNLRWDVPPAPAGPNGGVQHTQSAATAQQNVQAFTQKSDEDDTLSDLEAPAHGPDRTIHFQGSAAAREQPAHRPGLRPIAASYESHVNLPSVSTLFPDNLDSERSRSGQALQLQRLAAVLAAVAPQADRLGRLLSDLSPQLGRTSRNLAAAAALLRASDSTEDSSGVNSQQLAGALAAEGVHLDSSLNFVGLAGLPTDLRNLHTAGGRLVRSDSTPRQEILPFVHAPPSELRSYWARSGEDDEPDHEQANRAARAAENNRSWLRALRMPHGHSHRPLDMGGFGRAASRAPLASSAGWLTLLTNLRHVHCSSLPGSNLRHVVAQGLVAGRLTQVMQPPPNLSDVGGDVDDRLQLQASLAAIRRSLLALNHEDPSEEPHGPDPVDTRRRSPRIPPPARPAPPPRPSPSQPTNAAAQPNVAQLIGNAPSSERANLSINFENAQPTDVGPAPQTAPRSRRVSVLGARVRQDRAIRAASATAEQPPGDLHRLSRMLRLVPLPSPNDLSRSVAHAILRSQAAPDSF